MKALFPFSSGGSGFPGSPVAGVYLAGSQAELETIAAACFSTLYSVIVNVPAGGVMWYSSGVAMELLGGSVMDASGLPTPGTFGGIVFNISSTVAIYNNDSGQFVFWDGSAWQALSGN